jgi:hypothetical protein
MTFPVSASALGEEAALSAQVDKQSVYQDEEVHLTLKISGARGNVAAPRLPQVSGFDAFYSGRASHFAFINGRSESTVTFSYVLIPKASGLFTIGPFDVQVEGKTLRADPVQVEVLGQAGFSKPVAQPSAPASPQTQAPSTPRPSVQTYVPSAAPPGAGGPPVVSSGGDANIFLRVQPSKRIVYPNEQILLTYSLLTRYDTRYEGFEEEPETSGFWVEEFPMEPELVKQTETVDSRRYIRADIRKLALFPTAAGDYIIKPGTIKASVMEQEQPSSFLDEFFSDSFFSASGIFSRQVEKRLSAPAMSITVKPFPNVQKPASFKGAVGEFRMSASVDKNTVNQNEPVTLQVVIEGEGNIETLAAPALPELADVKAYEADTKSDFFKVKDLIAGKKTYEIILIPKLAGTLSVPPLEFSYFHPRTERYVTLSTNSFVVTVKPSLAPPPEIPAALQGIGGIDKEKVRVEGRDIRYIHERLSEASPVSKRLLVGLGAVNGLLTLLFVSAWLRQRREEAWSVNVAGKRDRFAKRNARRLLGKLRRLAREGGEEKKREFFDGAERLMNQYLADRLNLSPQGLTLSVVSERLRERGASEDVLGQITRFYENSGAVRYGRMSDFANLAEELLRSIERIVEAKL